jgi:hypothetical protein
LPSISRRAPGRVIVGCLLGFFIGRRYAKRA